MLNLLHPLTATSRLRRTPTRIVVVTDGPNPSFAYYIAPRLECADQLAVDVRDISAVPSGENRRSALTGAFVLFCRYLSGAWLSAIEDCADVIAGVGLFIDDDIAALANDGSVPLAYRLRLWRRHLIHRHRIARHCDVLLVATPELARRNADAHPHLLTPISSDDDLPLPASARDRVKVAFHSTSVHAAEHRWLRPVVHSALVVEPSLSFETIAGLPLSARWRGLPRTKIVSPLPWPHYRAETREHGADLLLAPLLPGRANAARSWTKRIDAMRLGAALLVSDPAVYGPNPEERTLGMCVPLEPASWVDAIRKLAQDRPRLARLRDLNRAHVLRARATAGPLVTDAMLPR